MKPELSATARRWSENNHDHRRDRLATAARTSFPIHLPRHVLTCKTQHFVHPLSLKNASRARLPSKSESWRCANKAFVRDVLQNLQVEDVKTKLSCETSLQKWKLKMWKQSFRARRPSKPASWRCENEALMRDFPPKVKVEDVKTKLSCETPLTNWKLKMWKRSFWARPPSKSESWRCENEAFVRDFIQKPTAWSCQNEAWTVSYNAGPIWDRSQ